MAGLTDLGVRIPLSARLYMTTADFGILPMMLMAFSISLLIGFSIAGLCVLKGGNPYVWFAIGGSTAIISQLLILESPFRIDAGGGRAVRIRICSSRGSRVRWVAGCSHD